MQLKDHTKRCGLGPLDAAVSAAAATAAAAAAAGEGQVRKSGQPIFFPLCFVRNTERDRLRSSFYNVK